MLTTNTRQYRISVRKLKSLHMFVFVVFFSSALFRVVPDSRQGSGRSMRTMLMRICICVRTGTHQHLHVNMYISPVFLRTRLAIMVPKTKNLAVPSNFC